MSDRSELLAEANALGLEFKKNISSLKLAAMVSEAKGEPAPIEENAPPSPELKTGKTSSVEEEEKVPVAPLTRAEAKHRHRRRMVAAARQKAFKTSVVTITNKDNRENDFMTTVYLSFENQYFGLAKNVPLDIPVELEEALIRIAAGTIMTLHKDEIVGGKRTGNKIPVRVKKFAISYSRSKE